MHFELCDLRTVQIGGQPIDSKNHINLANYTQVINHLSTKMRRFFERKRGNFACLESYPHPYLTEAFFLLLSIKTGLRLQNPVSAIRRI